MSRSRRLQSFDPEGEDVILSLATSWATAVTEQMQRTDANLNTYLRLSAMYDRMDGDVTLDHLSASWSATWTSEALLVISADNLERWIKRLYLGRGREPNEPVPQLRSLRNAIKHMDESEFDDEWIATPGKAQKRGLGALPGAQLPIQIGDRTKVFGLIDITELRGLVNGLLGELAEELDDYAEDMYVFEHEGR